MSLNGDIHSDGQSLILLAPLTISVAVGATVAPAPANSVSLRLAGMKYLAVEGIFLYGAGGTNVTAYVQTTLDEGASWFDIICMQFTTAAASKIAAVSSDVAFAASAYAPLTATDGSLTANTCIQGILGTRLRLKYVTTGTYSGATSLAVYASAKG